MHERKSDCVFCSLSSLFYFVGDKISDDNFKDEIKPSFKASEGLTFAQGVVMNHAREKGKPWCKILYKVFKDEYGHDPLICISPFTTLIQLKDLLSGIHHYVKVVGKWIFDSNFPFVLTLTRENIDYCCTDNNKIRGMDGYQVVLTAINFSNR